MAKEKKEDLTFSIIQAQKEIEKNTVRGSISHIFLLKDKEDKKLTKKE